MASKTAPASFYYSGPFNPEKEKTMFKVGDAVVLKGGGGPVMTVQRLADALGSRRSDDPVECVWFDGSRKIDDIFPSAALKTYAEPDPDTLTINIHD